MVKDMFYNYDKFQGEALIQAVKRFGSAVKLMLLGTEPSFVFDLSHKFYTLDDVSQVTFMFKQDDKIYYFNAFERAGTAQRLDTKYFTHRKLGNTEYLTLQFSVADTNKFEITELYKELINYEVAVTFKTGKTVVEEQGHIFVLDSVYNELQNALKEGND